MKKNYGVFAVFSIFGREPVQVLLTKTSDLLITIILVNNTRWNKLNKFEEYLTIEFEEYLKIGLYWT